MLSSSQFASINGRSIPLFDVPSTAHAFVALLSGVRHAASRKSAVDADYDKAFEMLWQRVVSESFHTNKTPKEIKKGLGPERGALFEKALTTA